MYLMENRKRIKCEKGTFCVQLYINPLYMK